MEKYFLVRDRKCDLDLIFTSEESDVLLELMNKLSVRKTLTESETVLLSEITDAVNSYDEKIRNMKKKTL